MPRAPEPSSRPFVSSEPEPLPASGDLLGVRRAARGRVSAAEGASARAGPRSRGAERAGRQNPEGPVRRPAHRQGHISLDMPAVAEDGRIVPVIIESDLPMTPEHYVKAVHLIVDHNPDPHLAAYSPHPGAGLGSDPDPHQDEAHHLGAGDPGDHDRRGVGGLRAGATSRSTGAADDHIGDARISVPDRIARGDLIIGELDRRRTRWTPDSSGPPTGEPIPAYFIKDVVVTYGDERGGPLRVDVRHQPGSGRELHAQGRQGGAAHDGLDRQQGRGSTGSRSPSRSPPPSILVRARRRACSRPVSRDPSRYLIVTMSAPRGGGSAPRIAAPPFVARRLADGVYAVLGDTGRGSEGRPNAGFIVTREGVIVVDALASPRAGRSAARRRFVR